MTTKVENRLNFHLLLPLPLLGSLPPFGVGYTARSVAEVQAAFGSAAKALKCVRLTAGAAPAANLDGTLDMSGQKITNVGTPTAAGDVATKGYVDGGGAYTAGVSADWPEGVPTEFDLALDALAARTDFDTYIYQHAGDGAAGDTIAERAFDATIKRNGTILSVEFMPSGTLTANDTNYATLSVAWRDGAGGGAQAVASQTTKITGGSGDWAAFVAEDLGTITNATVAPGAVLTFAQAKASSGVAVPAGALIVTVEPAAAP